MKYQIALNESISWIKKNFEPISIIVSGSIIRGNPDKNSDYDIYVIHTHKYRKRILKVFNEVECDIFINNKSHIIHYIKSEYLKNRPTTAHIISTGKILFGENSIKDIYELSKKYVNKPLKISIEEKEIKEYYLKTLLDDIEDVKNKQQSCTYIINKTSELLLEYSYIMERKPLPRLKERIENINNIEVKKLFMKLYSNLNNKNKIKILKKLFTHYHINY